MRFLPTADQRLMVEAVRDALAKACPPEVLRTAGDDAQQSALWEMLAEFGVFGVSVPEEFGGLGLDQRDAVGVLEETGRAGVPGPIAETFAVSRLLVAQPASPLTRDWLPRLTDGTAVVTLGLGDAPLVESADRADLLVLQHGAELHAVLRSDVALTRETAIDANRRLFSVSWSPSAATLISDPDNAVGGGTFVDVARDHLLLAISAQLLGLGRRLLDLSVRHVNTREQFGRPLGMFQAVQHRLADVAVGLEFTDPVVARAACSLAAQVPSISRDVAMAKVFASESAERAAYAALQVHGAIGYTREHDLHMFALRAWSLALAHGDARRHRQRVAADLLDNVSATRFPLD